jgi:hypothetical protein
MCEVVHQHREALPEVTGPEGPGVRPWAVVSAFAEVLEQIEAAKIRCEGGLAPVDRREGTCCSGPVFLSRVAIVGKCTLRTGYCS